MGPSNNGESWDKVDLYILDYLLQFIVNRPIQLEIKHQQEQNMYREERELVRVERLNHLAISTFSYWWDFVSIVLQSSDLLSQTGQSKVVQKYGTPL